MNIGNQILNIRKENQLTQEEFGKLFHVTRQTLYLVYDLLAVESLGLEAESNQFDISLQIH